MSLDDFILQAKSEAAKVKPRKAAAKKEKTTEFEQTQAQLRALKLELCTPIEVELRITVQTCTCGSENTAVNNVALVHKTSKSLDFWEACDNEAHSDLPRALLVTRTKIDCCPACFDTGNGVIQREVEQEQRNEGS